MYDLYVVEISYISLVAHTAARKLTEFFMLPFGVMSITMATYCGQNKGAKRPDRIKIGIWQAIYNLVMDSINNYIELYSSA